MRDAGFSPDSSLWLGELREKLERLNLFYRHEAKVDIKESAWYIRKLRGVDTLVIRLVEHARMYQEINNLWREVSIAVVSIMVWR